MTRVTCKIKDVISEVKSGDWGKGSPTENYTTEVLCVRGADIPELCKGNVGKMPQRFIHNKKATSKILSANNLIIEISGGSPTQSTGRIALISDKILSRYSKPLICSNFCKAITATGIQPEYLFNYWLYLYNKDAMFPYENGTTGIKNLDFNSFIQEQDISIPDIKTQQKIVSILSSIDEKIETNKRINDNLEQQAQALFKSWFVDFEPFRGGEFVDSELGLIPKGWRVVSLGEVTKQITEKVGNREDVTVLSPINSGELVLSEEYFTKQVFSKDLSKYLIVNPLSFAYNPARINIGSIGLNTFDFVGCVSPVYVVFECEPNYQYFFDFFKRTAMFKDEVALRAIGGVRQSLGYNDLSLIKTIYPTSDVVVEFNNLYLKMKEVMIKNTDQNEKFISLRDSLLPKLMSGELKINEFNC